MFATQTGITRNMAVRSRGRVLVVDDDALLLRGMDRMLRALHFDVETAPDGESARALLEHQDFNVIVSDITMPGMSGIQLLREVRQYDLDVPVVLVTGEPRVDTAVKALEYGAFRYLAKPVELRELQEVLERAVQLHRMALMKREAMKLLGEANPVSGDRAGLEASFDSALDLLWAAYQPIVSVTNREIYGYEALVRSDEPSLPHPGAILDAAERLDRTNDLGRLMRNHAAQPVSTAPGDFNLFVNLHARDLADPELTSSTSALAGIADRVVLEITERTALEDVKDARSRVAALREMGFRIAIDDLGAGYAGLTSFATLEPDIVKLDMTLTRDVHKQATKQKLVRSMISLCEEMGMMVVCEGVETAEERDALIELGGDLMQGYFFAKPGRPFPAVDLNAKL